MPYYSYGYGDFLANNLYVLLLIPVMFLSFNTQNLIADVFFWLFAYMALTERLLTKKG